MMREIMENCILKIILLSLTSQLPCSHFDATEKVLILHKMAQDKVYLCVLRYYILYAKTVFQ